jgi:hypothetical protein
MELQWVLCVAVILTAINCSDSGQVDRVVCYYDSRSRYREGKEHTNIVGSFTLSIDIGNKLMFK